MTPQLVDHAHTDSCIVIGCNLEEKRTCLFQVAVTSHLHHSCITVAVIIVNNALRRLDYIDLRSDLRIACK